MANYDNCQVFITASISKTGQGILNVRPSVQIQNEFILTNESSNRKNNEQNYHTLPSSH